MSDQPPAYRKVTGWEKKMAELHETNEVYNGLPKPFKIAAVAIFLLLLALVVYTYVAVLTMK